VLTCVFTGVIWAAYEYVLYKFLSPGLFVSKIEEMQEIWLNKGFSEELVELQSQFFTPFMLALSYVFSAGIWGAILSLPLAALLKRDKNPLSGDADHE
jgi:ABC-type Fe3+ transport system permease subunit